MKNRSNIQPGYLKLTELTHYSGLSRRTLKDFIQNGLPYFQKPGNGNGRGGGILVKISDFDIFMERFRQGQDPQKIAEELLR